MSGQATFRMLADEHPELKSYDYSWPDSPESRDIREALARYGWRLSDEDEGIASEYNDAKAFYGCRIVPLDGGSRLA